MIIINNFGEAEVQDPRIIIRRRVERSLHDYHRHVQVPVSLVAALPPFDPSANGSPMPAGRA